MTDLPGDMKTAQAPVWDRTWSSGETAAAVGRLDRIIFRQIARHVDPRGKEVLELGCGRGILSKYFLDRGASAATLVDFSQEAIKLARNLSGDSRARFVPMPILDLPETDRYDIVFSSGVAEHFSGAIRERIVAKHLALSRGQVVLIVPARPHFNTVRHRKPRTVRSFGWQYAFDRREMASLLGRDKTFRLVVNRRFHCLYGISAYELFAVDRQGAFFRLWNFALRSFDRLMEWTRLNRVAEAVLKPIDGACGGLLIAVAVKEAGGEGRP